MKYKVLSISQNGSTEYRLEIEEVPSVWSRFFHSKNVLHHVIYGNGDGHWESRPYHYRLSEDLREFATETVRDYLNGNSVRIWKQSSRSPW